MKQRIRAALRTHGGRDEVSRLGCALVGCAVIVLAAVVCALYWMGG